VFIILPGALSGQSGKSHKIAVVFLSGQTGKSHKIPVGFIRGNQENRMKSWC